MVVARERRVVMVVVEMMKMVFVVERKCRVRERK